MIKSRVIKLSNGNLLQFSFSVLFLSVDVLYPTYNYLFKRFNLHHGV